MMPRNMPRKSAKAYCAIKSCNSNDLNYSGFYRFPNDKRRAHQWAKLCDREDLLTTNTNLSNTKICGKHFQTAMFTKSGKRLLFGAFPTLFIGEPEEAPSSKRIKLSSDRNHITPGNTSAEYNAASSQSSFLCEKQISRMPAIECLEDELGIPQNVIYLATSEVENFKQENGEQDEETNESKYQPEHDEAGKWENENSDDGSNVATSESLESVQESNSSFGVQYQGNDSILLVNLPQFAPGSVGPSMSFQPMTPETPTPTEVPSLSHAQTQTKKYLMMDIPQRKGYISKIKRLQLKIRKLEKLVEKPDEIDVSDEEDYEEMFEFLCEKYLTPTMSKFVKTQVKRRQTNGGCKEKFPEVFLMYGD